jgi:hypothetical protein
MMNEMRCHYQQGNKPTPHLSPYHIERNHEFEWLGSSDPSKPPAADNSHTIIHPALHTHNP